MIDFVICDSNNNIGNCILKLLYSIFQMHCVYICTTYNELRDIGIF